MIGNYIAIGFLGVFGGMIALNYSWALRMSFGGRTDLPESEPLPKRDEMPDEEQRKFK